MHLCSTPPWSSSRRPKGKFSIRASPTGKHYTQPILDTSQHTYHRKAAHYSPVVAPGQANASHPNLSLLSTS